jgi:hypothetical protein
LILRQVAVRIETPRTPPSDPSAPMSSEQSPTCDDCYFRRHGLCALVLERPCPTFRAAGRILQPPHQPRLVPRPVALAAPPAGAAA